EGLPSEGFVDDGNERRTRRKIARVEIASGQHREPHRRKVVGVNHRDERALFGARRKRDRYVVAAQCCWRELCEAARSNARKCSDTGEKVPVDAVQSSRRGR